MESFVPQKVAEAIFNQILERPENKVCADCPNKSPTWASIDFGVFVCLRCAGAHRRLSPVVTRVRSAKIDDWKMDHIEIVAAVGNKLANDFYEYNLPSYFRKPDISTSLDEVFEMVQKKYVKALYTPKDRLSPVKEFLEARADGKTTAGSFNQMKKGQASTTTNVTNNTLTTKTTTVENNVPTKTQNLLDFDDDGDFGEFKSAPEKVVKKDISKPDVEVKFQSTNQGTQKSGIDLWDSNFEMNSSSVHHQKPRSADPFSFDQPQNTPSNLTQKSNSATTDSNKLYELYKTGTPEQQNTIKSVNGANGTNFTGGQSNYAFLDALGGPQVQQNKFGQQQQTFGYGMNTQGPKPQFYGGMQTQPMTSYSGPMGTNNFGGSSNSFGNNGFGGGFGGVSNGGFTSGNGMNSGWGKPQQQQPQPFSFNQPTTTGTFGFNTSQNINQPNTVKTGFSFV